MISPTGDVPHFLPTSGDDSSSQITVQAEKEKTYVKPLKAAPRKEISLYTKLVIVGLSMTEGFNIGYMESLMSIFRQRQIISSKIGLLTLMLYPFLLCFIGAPLVDKYYSPSFGKRKTYLFPCKMIIATALIVFSFLVDDAVDRNDIPFIAFYLFFVGLVQLFDFNALTGLRYEIFGVENTDMASYTLYAGIAFGSLCSYDLFTLLNSDYFCRDIIGISNSKLLTHRMINLFFAFINLSSGIGVMFVAEEIEEDGASRKMMSVFSLLKVFFTDEIYKRLVFWLLFSGCGVIALRATISLQLIHKGMRREDIIMVICAADICNLGWNYALKRFMKPGQILRVCTLYLVMYLLLLYIDLYNVLSFDPSSNYRRTVILFFVCLFLECGCPWMSYHIGIINSTTYKRYAATYATTLFGLVNLGKVLPVSFTVTLLDFINYPTLFIIMNIANLCFLFLAYKPMASKVDETQLDVLHAPIRELEGIDEGEAQSFREGINGSLKERMEEDIF